MQQPSRGPRQSTLRLLIVFGLGLVGALFFSPVSLSLWWLQPATAFMVLLIAVLIGWLIERNDRRNSGRASVGR